MARASCRHGEKMQKMLRGGESAFEELFAYACPKFITPLPPTLDAPSMNTNQASGFPAPLSTRALPYQSACRQRKPRCWKQNEKHGSTPRKCKRRSKVELNGNK